MGRFKIVGLANAFLGLTQLLVSFFLLFFTLPNINRLYLDLEISPPSLFPAHLIICLVLLMSTANLFVAFKLLSVTKVNNDKYLKYGVILLVVAFIMFGLLMGTASFSTTIPVYNLTSQLK